MSTSGGRAPIAVAAAPVSWGVFELESLPPMASPERVLDQMVEAGYGGTELGPPGFFGDGATVRERLGQRGLELVGAFLPLRLSRDEHSAEDRTWLAGALDLLEQATPGRVRPKAVLADASVERDRLAYAGRIPSHPETWLSARRLQALVDNLLRAGELCQRRGFDAVLHPHAGSYVETEAEIQAVTERLDPALVGLCLDTGHAALGGAHPVALARDYASLVRHVHLKDLNPNVLEEVTQRGGDMHAFWRSGVFAELGAGTAGIREVVATLIQAGYRGWIVVEQDRVVTERDGTGDLLAAQQRNRRFLAELGL